MRGAPANAVSRARQLRRAQTDAERKLWRHLRGRGLATAKFRRQFPIGPFIADFCYVERRLVVEVDGGHHAQQSRADERRTDFIRARGYGVIRFWDNEVI